MWFIFALAGAFFKALTNILRKSVANHKINAQVYIWFASLLEVIILGFFVLIFKPDVASILNQNLPAIIGCAIALNAAGFFNIKALEKEEVSYIAPLNAFIPIFTLLIAWLTLGELPPALGIFGILIVFLGAYWINITPGKVNWYDPILHLVTNTGARFALLVAISFAISTVFTKSITNNSDSLLGIFFLMSSFRFITLFYVPLTKYKQIKSLSIKDLRLLVTISLNSLLGAFAGVVALANTYSSYAISVRRFDIIITVLLGKKIFKDTNIRNKIFGSLLMTAGVMIMILS